MYILKRWALFFLIGIPFQVLTYLLYPFLVLYYVIYARKKLMGDKPTVPAARWSIADLIKKGRQDAIRDNYYIDTQDDHAAVQHMYSWAVLPELGYAGLKALVDVENKTLSRYYPGLRGNPVSGDCLASWCAAFTYRLTHGGDVPVGRLKILADSYIANCFGLPAPQLKGKVSNRSSCSGVNYTPDSWMTLNQPALGPQYFTSASLLLLAAKVFGWKYRLIYWAHYWIMGGWLYTFLPMVHTHANHFYDAQHVTTIGLYTVAKLSKNPMYRWTMWWMCKFMSPRRFLNPLFECWSADAGLSSKDDINECLLRCARFKHVWPQVWPGWHDWYNEDIDPKGVPDTREKYSVVAGAAIMLMNARSKLK